MATSTLSELITDCRSKLDETVVGFWDDLELARWCWEGARDVARRTEWNEKIARQDVESGRQTYTIPDDVFRIYRCEYRRNSSYSYALDQKTFHDMDDIWFTGREVAGSQPYVFSIWGAPGARTNNAADRQLYLYPTPSENITDGLILYYYAVPMKVDVNNFNAQVELPTGWEDIVVLYVEMVARRKEARDSRWREAQELYEQRLHEMMKMTRSWTDQQDSVVGAAGWSGGYPGWLVNPDW